MAKIITMPTTPNFVRSNFRLFRAIGQTASPFTGKQLTQEFDAVFWQSEVTLPPLNRTQAVEWQSFLMQLKGTTNHFKFADPDALTNTGTFSTTHLIAENRVSNTNVSLTVTNTNTITANASTFANAIVGDFIHITGMTNEENNGTHKITAKDGTNPTTKVTVDSTLVNEGATSGCKVQMNVKGATGLNLKTSGSNSGTIKKGDYLGVLGAASATANPVQLVMAVEDATQTSGSPNQYAVQTEPKLRSTLSTGHFVIFQNPKGLFRLQENTVDWSADRTSLYGISFSCIEVV
ncbi:hypothetical protein [Marinobacter sp.]|uniref:hypothetical protein n=1 Tax=Marinobacter sp. TaxID=50741 RepID=UPI00257B80BD|nr:hypothetical protein [Marinobacter sp.]